MDSDLPVECTEPGAGPGVPRRKAEREEGLPCREGVPRRKAESRRAGDAGQLTGDKGLTGPGPPARSVP